jgi:biotin operon repressor
MVRRTESLAEFSVKPVYKQVEESLSRYIQKKRLRPGAFLPPESELSELFGVSRVTLRKGMRQLIRNGVVESHPGRGHVVAQQTPVRRIAFVFGVDPLAPDCPPFFRLLAHAMRTAAPEQDFDPSFVVLDGPKQDIEKSLRVLARKIRLQQLSAAVLLRWGGGVPRAEEMLWKGGVPVLNCTHFGRSEWRVTLDSEAMIYEATRFLLKEGKRKIALVSSGPFDNGYDRAFAELGLTPPKDRIIAAGGFSVEAGYALTKRALKDNPDLEAIIVPDDFMERGVNAAVLECEDVDPEKFTIAHFAVKGEQFPPGCRRLMLEFDTARYAGRCLGLLAQFLEDPTAAPQPLQWIKIPPTLRLVD